MSNMLGRIPGVQLLLARVPLGLQQSLLMVFGNAAGQGFSALSLILITRALGPEQFGIFSVGMAILLMLVRINDLGLTVAVQRYGAQAASHAEANRIFSYTLKLKLIVAICIAVIGILSAQWLAQVLNFDHPKIIALSFILSAATVLYEHFQAMLQSLHRFLQSVVANTIQALAKFLGALTLVAYTSLQQAGALSAANGAGGGVPAATLITGMIFAWHVAVPVLPFLAYRKYFPKWLELKLKQPFTQEHSRVRSLALHSAVGIIAAGVIENIDILFVQGYVSTYEAGLLGGVSRIALLFNLMAYSLGTVLNPRVAKYTQAKDIGQFLKKSWLVVAASVLGFVAFIPTAGLVIQYSIGPEYQSGTEVLLLLMAAAFLSIAVMPFIATFFSFDVPWYFSASGVLQLTIVLAGNYFFVPVFGVEAAAWTRLVARAALFVFTVTVVWWYYRKLLNKRH